MCESEQKRYVASGEWQAPVIEGLFIRILSERRRSAQVQKGTRAYGCSRMQGYLFGEAVSAREFEKLLTAPPYWWMRRERPEAAA